MRSDIIAIPINAKVAGSGVLFTVAMLFRLGGAEFSQVASPVVQLML